MTHDDDYTLNGNSTQQEHSYRAVFSL